MNTLLTTPLFGGFLLLILFACCFLLVHFILLIKIGWKYHTENAVQNAKKQPIEKNEKPSEKPRENTPQATPNAPQPVYYIVEKKRKKTKSYYSEPKEFRFK